MKRLALLIRTLSGAFSAGIFTATGWLMGTRTLTMVQLQPCSWGLNCPEGGYQVCYEICYTYPTPMCLRTGCEQDPTFHCKKWSMRQYGCAGDCSCFCLEEMCCPQACGSCSGCPN